MNELSESLFQLTLPEHGNVVLFPTSADFLTNPNYRQPTNTSSSSWLKRKSLGYLQELELTGVLPSSGSNNIAQRRFTSPAGRNVATGSSSAVRDHAVTRVTENIIPTTRRRQSGRRRTERTSATQGGPATEQTINSTNGRRNTAAGSGARLHSARPPQIGRDATIHGRRSHGGSRSHNPPAGSSTVSAATGPSLQQIETNMLTQTRAMTELTQKLFLASQTSKPLPAEAFGPLSSLPVDTRRAIIELQRHERFTSKPRSNAPSTKI